MEPSERPPSEPVDDLLRQEQERWERVAGAKKPEDLQRALGKPPGRGGWRSAIFPLLVLGFLIWVSAQTLRGGKPVEGDDAAAPVVANFELPFMSPRSTGPVVAVPHGSVVAVVSSSGGRPVPVTPLGEGAREPVWRPDGRALLVNTVGGFVELPVDAAGTPQWTMRHPLGDLYHGVSPAYSPDGRRIAWIAVLADIVVADGRGGRPTLVTEYVDGREPRELDWSSRHRLAVATGGLIYVITPAGKVVQQVLAAIPTAAMPAWSPDGRRLAYTQLNPRPGDGIMRVNVTTPSSGTPPGQRVAPKGTTSAYPAWSPNGRSIAYARFVDGTWDLYAFDVSSRRERRLTHGPGDEIDPAWSPDGRRIAFVGSLLPNPR